MFIYLCIHICVIHIQIYIYIYIYIYIARRFCETATKWSLATSDRAEPRRWRCDKGLDPPAVRPSRHLRSLRQLQTCAERTAAKMRCYMVFSTQPVNIERAIVNTKAGVCRFRPAACELAVVCSANDLVVQECYRSMHQDTQ